MRLSSSVALLALISSIAACGIEFRLDNDAPTRAGAGTYPDRVRGDERQGEPDRASADATCDDVVDAWKELLVIDRAVLQSPEAKNDVEGAALSFRTQMEALAGGPVRAEELTVGWLESFATTSIVGPAGALAPSRPAVREVLLRPWRAATYERTPAMGRVPFRLIAVVNRIDLREQELGCDGDAGELRLVYTAVDPATRNALAMTVNVELRYPKTKSARAWGDAFHALADLDGEAYVRALATLVRDVTQNASPGRTRIRTNEALSEGDAWELRDFVLEDAEVAGGSRRLVPALLATTPRDELARSAALRSWAGENERALERGVVPELPLAMRAGASSVPHATFRWSGLPVSDVARATFSASTCNGCHGGERPSDRLRFQHLAPWDAPAAYARSSQKETQVSTYLYDPARPREGELARRARSLRTLLCAPRCSGGAAPTPPGPSPSAPRGYGDASAPPPSPDPPMPSCR